MTLLYSLFKIPVHLSAVLVPQSCYKQYVAQKSTRSSRTNCKIRNDVTLISLFYIFLQNFISVFTVWPLVGLYLVFLNTDLWSQLSGKSFRKMYSKQMSVDSSLCQQMLQHLFECYKQKITKIRVETKTWRNQMYSYHLWSGKQLLSPCWLGDQMFMCVY